MNVSGSKYLKKKVPNFLRKTIGGEFFGGWENNQKYLNFFLEKKNGGEFFGGWENNQKYLNFFI